MLTEEGETVTTGEGTSPALGLREALERIGVDDATRVRVETPDLNGILRGKYMALEKLESGKPVAFPEAILALSVGEEMIEVPMTQLDVGYPDLAAERQILLETTGVSNAEAEPVLSAARLQEIQTLIRQMPVSEKVLDAILALVRSARPGNGDAATDRHVAWGPGPRAGQAMMLCARARALYDGRLAPSVDDVLALAEPVLQHRMALTFGARAEGMSVRDVIAGLVRQAGG